MKRTPINSGELISVGYDAEIQVLEVELSNHTVYQFTRVSAEVYASLLRADMPYAYFMSEIESVYANSRVYP